MKFSIEDFFSVRHSSVTNPADLVTFTEEILHGKLFFVQCIIIYENLRMIKDNKKIAHSWNKYFTNLSKTLKLKKASPA